MLQGARMSDEPDPDDPDDPGEGPDEPEFVGRAAELRLLEDAWRRRESALIPIYGRRRIGKSELILHFLRGKQAIYHVGKVAPAPLQLREFLEESARALGEPLLAQLAASDWRTVLDAVVTRAKRGK